ncbi:MAG: type III-B CRISPR module RAMP protein Cmr1 [Promethearchaeota archaeon]
MKSFIIKTLTPLWTGDYSRRSEFLKSTSIIGSLRWWYEAIIRSFDYYACDPTLNPCEFKKGLSNVCPACRVFGCNGLKKQFIIRVNEMNTTNLFFKTKDNKWWLNKQYQNQNKALWGESNFDIIGLKENIEDILFTLLLFIQNYGGIGAKTQNGFGQFIIRTQEKKEEKNSLRKIYELANNAKPIIKNNKSNWYNFTDYFLLKYKINIEDPIVVYFKKNVRTVKNEPENWNYEYIPCSFDLKYNFNYNNRQLGLKKFFKEGHKFNKNFLNSVFGSKESGSRIFVSHLFKEKKEDNDYFLKIWSFLPKMILKNNNLEGFQNEIDTHIRKNVFESADLIMREAGKELIESVMKNE